MAFCRFAVLPPKLYKIGATNIRVIGSRGNLGHEIDCGICRIAWLFVNSDVLQELSIKTDSKFYYTIIDSYVSGGV